MFYKPTSFCVGVVMNKYSTCFYSTPGLTINHSIQHSTHYKPPICNSERKIPIKNLLTCGLWGGVLIP